MKKTLVSALTTALVVGAASTTFAAANPFSDVPADHWAYDAVSQLAKDGVIEGYGDSTFQGQSNITRYEMAQMVAKAMAKEDQANAADKAMIDKLAAEFSDELNNLGVRVSNLEKKTDNVKWTGEVRYTADRVVKEHNSEKDNTDNDLLFRLEPTATINNNWKAQARIDYNTDASQSSNATHATVDRAWVTGQYGNTKFELGKFPLYTEQGLVFDSNLTGAQVSIDSKKLTTTLTGGRYNLNQEGDKWIDHEAYGTDNTATFGGLGLTYKANKAFSFGAGYYYMANKDALSNMANGYGPTGTAVQAYGKEDAKIWNLGMTYNFNDTLRLSGAYAKNTEGDVDGKFKKAYNIELAYKSAVPENKGSFGIYAAYRYLGQYATIAPTYDGAMYGTKGWEFGTQYTFAKNIMGTVRYFNGKEIASDGNDNKVSKIFGRVEFFF